MNLKLLSSRQNSSGMNRPKEAQGVYTHLLLMFSFLRKSKDAFMSFFRFLLRMHSVKYIPSSSHCTNKEVQLGHNDINLSSASAMQFSIRISHKGKRSMRDMKTIPAELCKMRQRKNRQHTERRILTSCNRSWIHMRGTQSR